MPPHTRTPLLHGQYHAYLSDQDLARFAERVSERYTIGTLERLTAVGDRMARRAAVLALGLLANYESNAALGRALSDRDRGVRMLAENGIRAVWCRAGTPQQQQRLQAIVELNQDHRFREAVTAATRLIAEAQWLAETWNQRAVAQFNLGRFAESAHDCNQALEINPYHFGAATGMGQCHLQLQDRPTALACFRRAVRLNPNLEGVRSQILYLERALKNKP